ncbi:MAG: GNAT family N-acetyltransferase [Chitinophagaceae bacterium]|nr:GNAT family N-acetyltransferase [Chitinophagaceae bacterium]
MSVMKNNLFLKFFPDDLLLETSLVQLRILQPTDEAAFQELSKDSSIWKYFTFDCSIPGEMHRWVEEALFTRNSLIRVPFTIIRKSDGAICGSTSFGNISFFDKRIEIGWSWLGTPFMGTGINTHAKHLLLKYAFEEMHMERVEVKTDFLNERARAALLKIGMKEEGVLRSHMQMPHNRRRDSIYYSMLKEEWMKSPVQKVQ